MAVPEYSYVTVYFPSQISSVSSGGDTVTESGNQLSVERNDGENAGVITCMIENGYKISNVVWAGADEYNNLSVTFENNVITLHDDGQGSKSGSLTITVEQSNPKAVSLDNLQKFKEKCDDTYAKKTEIPEEYTLPVANASTLGGVKPVAKTSEMTQNVGVDSNGVLYTKPAPDISEQVSDLSQSVDDIYTILQQEVYNAQDVEQEYSSRETADGADIIDGALETVKKIQGATVKTTNLIPFPYEGATTTVNGVTFTNNGDGSVTINGTASGGNSSFMFRSNADKMNLLAGTTYYFTCAHGVLAYTDTDGTHYISAGSSFTWGTGWTFVSICIQLNEGDSETNLTVYPMLNEGSSALPYMPYFSGLKNAYFQGLRSTGRNLIPFPYNGDLNANGATFTVNDDGSITVNKPTANGQVSSYYLAKSPSINLVAGKTYTISGGHRNALVVISYTDEGTVKYFSSQTSALNFTWNENFIFNYIYIHIYANNAVNNVTVYPMLNYGSSALPYEPYISHEISLDAAIELPAWDSINPTTGKRTVQSNTLTFDGTESGWYLGAPIQNTIRLTIAVPGVKDSNSLIATITEGTSSQNPGSNTGCYMTGGTTYAYFTVWFRQSAYPNVTGFASAMAQLAAWNSAGNPLTICYQTATETESDISMEDRLPAYKNGSEAVIQGATDNSEYGAENTLTQNYAEVKGTTEGGNS